MPHNDTKVFVRMPKDIYESLIAMADKDRRSVNAQILVLLEKAVQESKAQEQKLAAE